MLTKNAKFYIVIIVLALGVLLTGCTDGLTGGSITGTKTGSVTGIVKDNQGNPLPGVSVSIGNKVDTTDNNGVFLVNQLEVGDYLLIANLNGFETTEKNIVVESGSNTLGKITLEKTTAPLAKLNIAPGSVTLEPGQSQTFTAKGFDASGNPVNIDPNWTISDEIGSLDSTGGETVNFTASSTGSGKITVSVDDMTAEAAVQVSTSTDTFNYNSSDYLNTTEGFGIKYHVADSFEELDTEVWAVSQYFEHSELDYVFTLNGGEGFRNSTLSGINDYIDGKALTRFRSGYPVGNQAHFYFNFSLPIQFNSGDSWSVMHKSYSVESVSNQTVNRIEFSNCIKINIDNTENPRSDYFHGKGYMILAKDIGIVKVVFDRTYGGKVIYKYLKHETLTQNNISGQIVNNGTPVEGVSVQLATEDWGNGVITDNNGNFSITAYGPILTLRNNCDDNKIWEYTITNITGNTSDIVIDLASLN